MVLCGSCNDVLRSKRDFKKENTIHSTWRSFLAAVDGGCFICRGLFCQLADESKHELHDQIDTPGPPVGIVREQKDDEEQDDDDNARRITSWRRFNRNSRTGFVQLGVQTAGLNPEDSSQMSENPKPPRMHISKVKIANDEESGSALPAWAISSSSTNSKETFSKIKAWLDKCDERHAECHAYRDETRDENGAAWRPTRLIQITAETQGSDKTETLMCRVVETKLDDMPVHLRYVTLSHRWLQNQHNFPKLTVGNLPYWKARLPIETLQQTFRDVLLVAHRMGINYVWIDSLCIIQDGDDLADWRKESPMMYKVYSQAAFNICAAKKVELGNDEGLFSRRDPSNIQPLQTDLDGHYLIAKRAPIDAWNYNMENSPLGSRGWVFQEQLLSRANVHFCSGEVFFECMETQASESLGLHEDYCRLWGSEWRSFFKENLRLPDSPGGRPWKTPVASEAPYQCWHESLERYTIRQLTNFDDRLVALSGVAQYFKKVIPHNDFYIAGLWYSRLSTEMLWEVRTGASREDWVQRNEARRYMTFSWIAIPGTIWNQADLHYGHEASQTRLLVDTEVVKYRMEPSTTDNTAPLREQRPFRENIFALPSMPTVEIRLFGHLRPMRLRRNVSGVLASRHRLKLYPDLDLELQMGRYWLEGNPKLDFEIISSELSALNDSGRLFLMPMAEIRGRGWFLLLELVETIDGTNMKRFRRIGVHTLDTDYGRLARLMEILFSEDSFKIRPASDASCDSMSVHYENLNALPCWHYDESSKKHTIFVI